MKTKGIVLNHIKYNDNSRIVSIFTRENGRKSFIVYGLGKSKKNNLRFQFFQPLSLVELEFRDDEKKSLQKIKNISFSTVYETMQTWVDKISVTFFLTEVLTKVLKPDIEDETLFDFIQNSLQIFDLETENYTNFHLIFLLKLSKFFGFAPENNFSDENKFFHLQEGKFISEFDNKLGMSERFSRFLNQLIFSAVDSSSSKIEISNAERSFLLKKILQFYSLHIEDLQNLKSLDVLSEIYK